MCTGKNKDDDAGLKQKNPIKYYLKHYNNKKIMDELRWENPELYNRIQRLHKKWLITNHEPIYKCPECNQNIITDEWGEEYCNNCGLVTRTHYPYVAGQKIHLPFGIK